jgi:hypothetical protein
MEWLPQNHPAEFKESVHVKNQHFEIWLKDCTTQLTWLNSHKPEKQKGEKYQNWLKSFEHTKKYYEKNPYWIQIIFWDDEDMLSSREFSTFEEAENLFLELATTKDEIDFNSLGFR